MIYYKFRASTSLTLSVKAKHYQNGGEKYNQNDYILQQGSQMKTQAGFLKKTP